MKSGLLLMALVACLATASAHVTIVPDAPAVPIPVNQPWDISVDYSVNCVLGVVEYDVAGNTVLTTALGEGVPSTISWTGHEFDFSALNCDDIDPASATLAAHGVGIITVELSELTPAGTDLSLVAMAIGAEGPEAGEGPFTVQAELYQEITDVRYHAAEQMLDVDLLTNGPAQLQVETPDDVVLHMVDASKLAVENPTLSGTNMVTAMIPMMVHDADDTDMEGHSDHDAMATQVTLIISTLDADGQVFGNPVTSQHSLGSHDMGSESSSSSHSSHSTIGAGHDDHEPHDHEKEDAPFIGIVPIVAIAGVIVALRRRS